MPQLAQEDDQETLARSGPMNRWISADHLQPAVPVPGEADSAAQSVLGSSLEVLGSEAISGQRRVALVLWPLDLLSSDSREQLGRGTTTPDWLKTFHDAQPATASLQNWLRNVLHHPHGATPALQGRITGPVRLIEQVSRAWRLTSEELAQLL